MSDIDELLAAVQELASAVRELTQVLRETDEPDTEPEPLDGNDGVIKYV